MPRNIISFDWALKYTLRDKANFDVLEGLFSTILDRPVKIDDLLESESNQGAPDERLIRLDLKARLGNGELALIEFQYKPEHHFFRRLLFYTSKTLVEHVKSGSHYEGLPKVYTISVCDFRLGRGDDYVYHGRQKFVGLHSQQELRLNSSEAKRMSLRVIEDIFPEYILISLGNFPDKVQTQLDEWLYTLKTGFVEESFSAPGLNQAAERLDLLKLNSEDRKRYEDFAFNQRIAINQTRAEVDDARNEGRVEGEAKGRAEGEAKGRVEGEAIGRVKCEHELILQAHQQGRSAAEISQFLGIEIALVQSIIDEYS